MTDSRFRKVVVGLAVFTGFAILMPAQQTRKPEQPGYTSQLVPVAPNVKLEVLDWGGTAGPSSFWPALGSMLVNLNPFHQNFEKFSAQPPPPPRPADAHPAPPILLAIVKEVQRYTAIHVSVLAFFAVPSQHGETVSAQADAFQSAIPQAHAVRILDADHFIFKSNERQVIDEMNILLKALSE